MNFGDNYSINNQTIQTTVLNFPTWQEEHQTFDEFLQLAIDPNYSLNIYDTNLSKEFEGEEIPDTPAVLNSSHSPLLQAKQEECSSLKENGEEVDFAQHEKNQQELIKKRKSRTKPYRKLKAKFIQIEQDHQKLAQLVDEVIRITDLNHTCYCNHFSNTELKAMPTFKNEEGKIETFNHYLPQAIKIIVQDSIAAAALIDKQDKQLYLEKLKKIDVSASSCNPPPPKRRRIERRKKVESVANQNLTKEELLKLKKTIRTKASKQKQREYRNKLEQDMQQFSGSGKPIRQAFTQYRKVFPNTAVQPMDLSQNMGKDFNYLNEYIPKALTILFRESIAMKENVNKVLLSRLEDLKAKQNRIWQTLEVMRRSCGDLDMQLKSLSAI